MPNHRELVAFLLIAVLIVFGLVRGGPPRALGRAFIKILPLVLLFLGYFSVEVFLGLRAGLWRWDFWGATLFWLLFSGFGLLLSSVKAAQDSRYFLRLTLEPLGISAMAIALVSVFVFSFAVELVVQVVAACCVLVMLGPSMSLAAKRSARIALSLIFGGMVAYSIVQLIAQWSTLDWVTTWKQFVLPFWLGFALSPFIFFLAVYMEHELAFSHAKASTGRKSMAWTVKFAFVVRLHVRLRRIAAFRHRWAYGLGRASGWKEAMAVMDDFLAAPARERLEREEEARRAEKYAGTDALDERGRRLDRREFDRTKRILTLLFNRQSGHYRNGQRYPLELVDRHPEDYSGGGLPAEPDLTLVVADDGQSWYAWRRTITGWCFGIGAAGPPNDKWKYEGPEPPRGTPSPPEWIDDLTTVLPPDSNWRRN